MQMETIEIQDEQFDQSQSLQVIREMIEVSRKKLQNDGILFILWGYALCFSALSRFLIWKILLSNMQMKSLKLLDLIISFSVLVFTIYYLIRQQKKVKTYIRSSLRWVWFAAVGCLILINLIQMNTLHKINFELQHPVFMVVIAFAVVITGGLLRYRLMIFMGILFALLAYGSSFFELYWQLLFEGIAWFLAFCIPGHILYAKRTS
jgi:hypothetical protein